MDKRAILTVLGLIAVGLSLSTAKAVLYGATDMTFIFSLVLFVTTLAMLTIAFVTYSLALGIGAFSLSILMGLYWFVTDLSLFISSPYKEVIPITVMLMGVLLLFSIGFDLVGHKE